MPVNHTKFFREATLRICSSLHIETALHRCLNYLVKFIPISKMRMNLYEQGAGIVRNIATVTQSGIEKLFPPTTLSKEAMRSIESAFTEWQEVLILNRPELHPVPQSMFQWTEKPNMSSMIMHLVIEGKRVGILVVQTEGRDKYTESHAKLFSLLREPVGIAMSNALRYYEVLRLKDMLDAENQELSRELLYLSGDEIIGADFGLKGVMERAWLVAPLDSPVLLLGETGVGKEVIANAIHYSSPRKDGPLIKVNCGAIPESLLDSELFGHEKGAFTGAIAKTLGRFERADRGTIFLDEIGELPLPAQVRLLRVLQQKEIERVGGASPITVDVRIIAATHRNLGEMIGQGQFREDLWFRLSIFPIIIPPLSHRVEDIPALVHHFVERKSKELKIHTPPPINPESIEQLKTYHWPGNVRELENMVERALIQSRGQQKSAPLDFFDFFSFSERENDPRRGPFKTKKPLTLDEAMVHHIKDALHLTKGKIYGPDGAAKILNINPNTLRSRMRKLGLLGTKG